MYRSKGFTLVETLFAFMVYLCIIFILISFINSVSLNKKELSQFYNTIEKKEGQLSSDIDIIEAIDLALH